MKKWIFILYLVAFTSYANQQYSEGTCILLENQVKEFSAYPQSQQFKTAKRTVDKYCINPVKKAEKLPSNLIHRQKPEALALVNEVKKTITNNTIQKPNQALEAGADKSKINVIKPMQGVFDFVLKIGFWLLLLSFGVAFIKALITLTAKKTAKSLFNKLTDRVEPTLPQTQESSVLKQTIADIIASDIAKDAGKSGELIVNNLLDEFVKECDLNGRIGFSHYQNILLTNELDELTEIDHLIVSPVGVFVIESKNYSGFIFGSQHQAKWTQTLAGAKTQFMNPLRQNYKHCLAVSRLLGVVDGVESIVLFHDKATFKTNMPENVRFVSEIKECLASFTVTKFSISQVEEFNKRISKVLSVTSKSDFTEHLKELETKKSAKTLKV